MEKLNAKRLERKIKTLENEAKVWSYMYLLFDYIKLAAESEELAKEHGYNPHFIKAREEVVHLLDIFVGVSKERANALYEQLAILKSILEKAKSK